MKKKKIVIAYVMVFVGCLLVFTCNIPASPLQMVADAGFVCVLIGAGIVLKEVAKLMKSRKKDDEETQKW